MTCEYTTRIECPMDATVSEDEPKVKFGDKPHLLLRDDPALEVYMKFDVHRPRWKNKTIIGVSMRVWVPEDFDLQTVSVFRVTEKWREDTIKWSNKPAFTASGSVAPNVSAGVLGFWTIDIDDIFDAWITDEKAVYGVLLQTSSSDVEQMFSSEAREQYRPELLINWSE